MKPTMLLPFHTQKIAAMTAMFVFLIGCVGIEVSTPGPRTQRAALTDQPSDSDQITRAWCGVTLWAVVVPIPLKLPVCKLQMGQSMTSPLHACGPLMVLGPIVHGYEGNALCGTLPN
ncbi:hypothetical protein [Pseudomonas frederiksbergensis]|uniref:Lipoprotein n=1 Tax=Pseudomonas frederiksbergensis TaxID=104087 RepID=A0A6L5BV68_9PSED|nr:hypothetical protein [Pseudomonas frederiksbergensis]KAF2391722.1 hypothetical protein FX983_06207 [Pseudomonas frederiksbergensis]